ncbi:hypothetical protein ACS0TY_011922 [Phlomoides rotata]
MILLGWNCMGLGHPAAIPTLCELVRACRPDVIFLSEMLSHNNKIEEIRCRLGYECAFAVNSVDRSGAPISDHNPILVDTIPVFIVAKAKRFQFENKWLDEPDLNTVVTRSWTGFKDCELLHRLHATADVFQTWGKHIATAWKKNKKDLEDEIGSL